MPDNPSDLLLWWEHTTRDDYQTFAPKLAEYGADDLARIGQTIHKLTRHPHQPTHQQATELGIYFYIEGKLARAHNAYTHHHQPSDDTLKDITIYSLMARATRQGLI